MTRLSLPLLIFNIFLEEIKYVCYKNLLYLLSVMAMSDWIFLLGIARPIYTAVLVKQISHMIKFGNLKMKISDP